MTADTSTSETPVRMPNVFGDPVHFLAFGFGSGLAPKAPGTWGTVAAIPPYLLFADAPLWFYVGMIVFGFAAGIAICDITSKYMGVHDHGGIVWDEIIGYWITMLAAPVEWTWIIAGFLLFRLFDIWKPWPIRVADAKVHGGLGIMIDDVIAGVYALLALQLLIHLVG